MTSKKAAKLNIQLQNAVQDGKLEEVERLINAVVDLEATDYWGRTALMIASEEGYREIVELLLLKGADIETRDYYGWNALMRVSQYGASIDHKEIVELLLDAGADVEAKSLNGNTALQFASMYGHKEIVEILLDAGADINAKTNDGNKAIHYAESISITKVLIENGADPESIGKNNQTLLNKLQRYEISEKSEKRLDLQELIRFLIEDYGAKDE